MNKHKKLISPVHAFLPTEAEGFDSLAEIALDMRSAWNHSADEVWSRLDPTLWKLTHNPWVVLQTVSRDRLEHVFSDPVFRKRIDDLLKVRREAADSTTWFSENHSGASLTRVAYFSMEYMLSEALPIYSGGLGNVAGDQLKAAGDLGVPLVAVGLLYQQGYFRQIIDRNGAQNALFPYNDPGQLPVIPLRDAKGEWLRVEVEFPGCSVWLRAWQVIVGRVRLYLLDSNDPANFPAHRQITSELYGGGPELRLMQEIVLGIGGWRLLSSLGMRPEVCHLNEGHAAFAVLERSRTIMAEMGMPFEASLAIARAGTLFTTHTPVAAGFDLFPPSLIEQYLGGYVTDKLGIELDALLALGRKNPEDSSEYFNMAYLAVNGSMGVNGVSSLHGKVSRRIFQQLFPNWPEAEVPVGHITNGVHTGTWDSEEADELWTGACGKERWLGTVETLGDKIRGLPDYVFWECRSSARASLVDYIRERLAMQLTFSGSSAEDIQDAGKVFDKDTLTLGFARRFAAYKRPNLLLRDADRLLRMLLDVRRPVQLVIAGKAHPSDQEGQSMILEWTRFMRRPGVNVRAVFISDYDMLLTEQLVQGVDVWINTPRRPWEACGTSGMKVLVNGGLNLSELDGWWAEAYSPEVGWAVGDGREHDPGWDAVDADALYNILEREVVKEFYERDEGGIPSAWVSRVRESMARLTPLFSANRSVREYTEKYYLPCAEAFIKRAAARGSEGGQVVQWRHRIEEKWAGLRFGAVDVETRGSRHLFSARLYMNGLSPDDLRVEIYADGLSGEGPFRQEMVMVRKLADGMDGYAYGAEVVSKRPAAHFTARVIPYRAGVEVPLEIARILWQR